MITISQVLNQKTPLHYVFHRYSDSFTDYKDLPREIKK